MVERGAALLTHMAELAGPEVAAAFRRAYAGRRIFLAATLGPRSRSPFLRVLAPEPAAALATELHRRVGLRRAFFIPVGESSGYVQHNRDRAEAIRTALLSGLTASAAARSCGCSVGAVYRHKRRLRSAGELPSFVGAS